MKKYFFTVVIFIVSLSFTTCSDDDKDEIIPTTEFVPGSPYRWSLQNEGVFHIVNSISEMYGYIESEDGSEIAANTPDFDKYTLLVGNVRTTSGISKIETKLIKHNEVDYTFEIHVSTNDATVAENRVVAVTTPKLSKAQIVEKVIVKAS
jgi:hypothetical protein